MKELMNRIWKKEEGFSLIELIIVIAILAIIAAIAVPNLIGNIQRANESTDASNAKMIHDAVNVAIGLQPDLEGTTMTNQPFVDIAAPATDVELIIDGALKEFNDVVPQLKASTNTGADSNFQVTIDATGIVSVQNANGVTIYPEP